MIQQLQLFFFFLSFSLYSVVLSLGRLRLLIGSNWPFLNLEDLENFSMLWEGTQPDARFSCLVMRPLAGTLRLSSHRSSESSSVTRLPWSSVTSRMKLSKASATPWPVAAFTWKTART